MEKSYVPKKKHIQRKRSSSHSSDGYESNNEIVSKHPEEFHIGKMEKRVSWAVELMENSSNDREGKGYMKVIPHCCAYIVFRLKSSGGPEFLPTNNDDCYLRDLSEKEQRKYISWFVDNGMESRHTRHCFSKGNALQFRKYAQSAKSESAIVEIKRKLRIRGW